MIYNYQEYGVAPGSELFLSTPSKLAESVLFYLHRCGRFILTKEYDITRTNFNNYLMFYVDKGSMKIQNEGKTYIANEGDVGIINCHMPHSYASLEDGTIFTWCHFDGSNTNKMYRHIIDRHQAVFHVSDESPICRDIHWIVDIHRRNEAQEEAMFSEDMISGRLHNILAAMLFAVSKQGTTVNTSRNPLIEQAINYIRNHYMEAIEVNDVADAVSISRFHFTRLFKNEVGYTPHEYIAVVRINRAKELLKSTDYSVAQIANLVGYEYASSFSTIFQGRIGMTPKKYRDTLI